MAFKEDGTVPITNLPKNKRKTTKTCTACLMVGHAKHNAKKCPKNPKDCGPAMKKVSRGVYTQTAQTINYNNNGNRTTGMCSKCQQRGHKRNNISKYPDHPNYIGPLMQKLSRGAYISLDICTNIAPEDNNKGSTPTHLDAPTELSQPNRPKQPTDNSEPKKDNVTNH